MKQKEMIWLRLCTTSTSEESVISSGEKVIVTKENMHQILVEMTAARARSAIRAKGNAQTLTKKLEGRIPTIEDWHTKANFLGVSSTHIYVVSVNHHEKCHKHKNYIILTHPVICVMNVVFLISELLISLTELNNGLCFLLN